MPSQIMFHLHVLHDDKIRFCTPPMVSRQKSLKMKVSDTSQQTSLFEEFTKSSLDTVSKVSKQSTNNFLKKFLGPLQNMEKIFRAILLECISRSDPFGIHLKFARRITSLKLFLKLTKVLANESKNIDLLGKFTVHFLRVFRILFPYTILRPFK